MLDGYSQDFVAQDKCKTVAEDQIGQGSQVEFQVAGGCGLGALTRPRRRRVSGAWASTPTSRPSGRRPDERAQAGRRRRVRHDQADQGGHVQGRHRRALRSAERRRRRSARSARRCRRRSSPVRSGGSRLRQDRVLGEGLRSAWSSAGRALGPSLGDLLRGRAQCPPPFLVRPRILRWRTRPDTRAARHHQAVRGSSPTTMSTSSSPRRGHALLGENGAASGR